MEFLLISLALSVGLTMIMRWRARKAQERYEAQVRAEMERRAAAGEAPFGMLPFGGLLERMLTQGAWTRSYAARHQGVSGAPETPSAAGRVEHADFEEAIERLRPARSVASR